MVWRKWEKIWETLSTLELLWLGFPRLCSSEADKSERSLKPPAQPTKPPHQTPINWQRRLFRSCFSKESILRVEEKERHLIKMARFPNFLLLTVCSPLIFGKPQYGGAPVQTPVSAPVVQAPSQISCFTTQETIWDTQYIEKTEKQCHQEQIQQFRQACQTVYKNSCQTVNKQVCSQQYRQESQPYTETECGSPNKLPPTHSKI